VSSQALNIGPLTDIFPQLNHVAFVVVKDERSAKAVRRHDAHVMKGIISSTTGGRPVVCRLSDYTIARTKR
jgi:hypothetical protein